MSPLLRRAVLMQLAALPVALAAQPRVQPLVHPDVQPPVQPPVQPAGQPPVQPAGQVPPSDIRRGRVLRFPADHGAHLATRTEWWYATGWLGSSPQAPSHGVQITFFRSRTGFGSDNASRFAPRHLLFAHAAVLDVATGTHVHDQRIVRWSGAAGAAGGQAALDRGNVQIDSDWSLRDDGTRWLAKAQGNGLQLDLALVRTQPLLLQGDAGFSRKGPQEDQASHYYSEPQLAANGSVTVHGRAQTVAAASAGRAWMDHEWSDQILHPQAVGWDWIGINLFDGSALTAFVLRRADGSALWAGGSYRAAGGAARAARAFIPEQVRFEPGRTWRSPATGASYPVQWTVDTPAGRFGLRALADAQELDSRGSTGTVYWEGLSELLDAQGKRVGLGYLEMTGYTGPIKLGT